MKKFPHFLVALLFLLPFSTLYSQQIEKAAFRLTGPCMDCGIQRLEEVLKGIRGYRSFSYNEQTRMLSLELDPSQGSVIDIQLELSFNGYNAGDFDYTPMPGLPECCREGNAAPPVNSVSEKATGSGSTVPVQRSSAAGNPEKVADNPPVKKEATLPTLSASKEQSPSSEERAKPAEKTISSVKKQPAVSRGSQVKTQPVSNETSKEAGMIPLKETRDATPAHVLSPLEGEEEFSEEEDFLGDLGEPEFPEDDPDEDIEMTDEPDFTDPDVLDGLDEEEVDDTFIYTEDTDEDWGGWYDADDQGNLIKVPASESEESSSEDDQ